MPAADKNEDAKDIINFLSGLLISLYSPTLSTLYHSKDGKVLPFSKRDLRSLIIGFIIMKQDPPSPPHQLRILTTVSGRKRGKDSGERRE